MLGNFIAEKHPSLYRAAIIRPDYDGCHNKQIQLFIFPLKNYPVIAYLKKNVPVTFLIQLFI